METLTDLLLKSKHRNRLITPETVNRLAGGTSARQWGLVNRALKSGDLIRLKRGLYVLSPVLTRDEISRLSIANRMVPESYITQETALAYYGWLSEEPVLVQSCIGSGRSRVLQNYFGEFIYERIPVSPEDFLKGVERISLSGTHILIASRERALGDTVYRRGLEWEGIIGLCEQLRTDVSYIYGLDLRILRELSGVYRSARTKTVLSSLANALGGSR
ncbi:MAG: hypothetical protein K8S62_12555 [Candidatus Sabulitectum sp.]|nr:hypothetical protein [Candidatus Sabulitectum sp.]